jgi:Zn-dependent protease/predicted transcriptional regulator
MKYSWKIGKIAGIDIYVDSSWFVIFVLFTWVLATSYFPQQYPDWKASQSWLIGLITSLLIFASVLIHELAHSLVAKAQGEEVSRITLFILGGVAQISGEPKQPLKEFTMALVGPLTSLGLAIVFFVVSFFLRGVSEFLAASISYLALINFVLALFNLLPGFPMDGGRVLRSLIWKVTGNLRKATSIASKVGQGFAFLLIFLGILQILRVNLLGGFWLIFLGWFLHSAAIRGYQQVNFETMLSGVTAKDLMREDFERISGDILVQDLVDGYILQKKERVFLVSDNGSLQGIVCLEDVKATPREKWSEVTVSEIMTPREKLEAVSPYDDGKKILNSLTAKDIHQVPVVEGGRVTGIICRSDILRYIQLRSELGV